MRNADTPSLITRTTLRYRARTLYRWIDGAVTTSHRRLGDVVNREDTGGILVSDEFFTGGGEGTRDDRPTSDAVGALNTQAVLFIVPVEGGPPPGRDPFAWVKKRPERVRVGTGPFEIEGDLYMVEGARLKEMIATTKPIFIVLAKATVRRVDEPSFFENHGAVFVNRRAMDFLVPVSAVP
jgi:hypothetical protein